MKLTVFAGGFARIGGVESFLCHLLPALADHGIACRLLCWAGADSRLDALSARGIDVRRSPFRWGCRRAWPDRLLAASSRAAILDSDVLLFVKPVPEPVHRRLLAWCASRVRTRVLFVTPYRPAEMWPSPPPLLPSFDAIAVQAESFRTDLLTLGYAGPITVLPYIPPACTAVASFPPGPLQIGYLGRLVPDKNLPYLLQTFRLLLHRRPAVLNLFGAGPLDRDLRRLAHTLGIASAVHFHGRVPPDRVPHAIDSCSRFAFTSLTEGQCLAALEILARGRPLLATPVGAFPEVLADSRLGAIAPHHAPESFAQSLLDLDGREPEQVQRAFASRFHRDAIIDDYLQWCRGPLSPPPSANVPESHLPCPLFR